MHISSVRLLLCSAAVTSKSQSVSLIVRFYPLKRKESSPAITAGSQRLGYLSIVMAHCSFTTVEPAGKHWLPSLPLPSHIITVSVAWRFIGRNWTRHSSVTEWSSWSRRHRSNGCFFFEVQTLKRGCQIVFPFLTIFYCITLTCCFRGVGQGLEHRGELRQWNFKQWWWH